MSDSNKSKKELIAELEALRSKMRATRAEDSTPGAGEDNRAGMTRRDVLAAAWVAPIILTVPLGASVVSSRAYAIESPVPTTAAPTRTPTNAPTNVPTNAPTTPVPTRTPTNAPTRTPTNAPTSSPQTPAPQPTAAPTTPPTAFPTAFPTAAPEIVPVELSDFDVR